MGSSPQQWRQVLKIAGVILAILTISLLGIIAGCPTQFTIIRW